LRTLAIVVLSLLLCGCNAIKANMNAVEPQNLPEPVTKSHYNELVNLTPPNGPPITVAMYGFGDKTGQRKENDKFSVLSSAVTQGGEVFLIKAMQDAGKGKWFQVVERVGLDNLIKERQLIRNQRETYEGKDAKPLSPMLIAGIMVEGGIVGYDTNLSSGGAGAALLGIGANAQYRTDVVTVIIRLISVHTGEVLISAGATKTILSTGISGNVMKFVDHGTMSVQTEMGSNTNESSTYAVRLATEAAVVDLIKQGAAKGLWKFAPTKAKTESQTVTVP
jgi:curli production assembly/transport component CsgG